MLHLGERHRGILLLHARARVLLAVVVVLTLCDRTGPASTCAAPQPESGLPAGPPASLAGERRSQ